MQVRVTARGFIYWVRHPGEVIEIAEHLFSPDWMEKIEASDDAAKQAADEAASDLSEPALTPAPDFAKAVEPIASTPTTLDVK